MYYAFNITTKNERRVLWLTFWIFAVFNNISKTIVCENKESYTKSIAIIGSGITGSSQTYFLREIESKYNNLKINIDLYDHNDRIGGRVRSYGFKIPETKSGEKEVFFEAGASIAIDRNRYIKFFADMLGLKQEKHFRPKYGDGQNDGVNKNEQTIFWNGNKVVFRESKQEQLTKLKFLFRYKLSLFRTRNYVEKMVRNFERIYDLQLNQSQFYTTNTEMLKALNLYKLTQKSVDKFFEEHIGLRNVSNIRRRELLRDTTLIADEILSALVHNNYNCDLNEINGFAGTIGCTPFIVGSEQVQNVKNGENYKICQGLIDKSMKIEKDDSIFLETEIHEIVKTRKGKFSLIIADKNGTVYKKAKKYDYVVLAAPLEFSDILYFNQTNIDQDKRKDNLFEQLRIKRKFQLTYVTFVSGVLSGKYFGMKNDEEMKTISNILMSGDNLKNKDFSSLSTLYFYKNPNSDQYYEKEDNLNLKRIVKIFSLRKLSTRVLSKIFSSYDSSSVKNFQWRAYPKFYPPEKFAPIILDDNGLYYPNSIENAASAMEIMAVASKNVALLIENQIVKQHSLEKLGLVKEKIDETFFDKEL